MKIKIEIDKSLEEDEIILHCRELNEDAIDLQQKISNIVGSTMRLTVNKGDTQYYLKVSEILFIETADQMIAVHTANQIYNMKQKLYELEQILPGSFLRVSKSTIINTSKIRSVRRNLTGSSEVEFEGSHKQTYVSRSYYPLLSNKLEEKRLKK